MGRSFDILVAEYRPMVLSYIRAIVEDEHLAEDLTQDTFVAAHASIETFDPERSFGAWLRGIARNKVLSDRRAVARHPLVVDSHVVEGMEQVYHLFDDAVGPWEERLGVVRKCIGQLSDNLRSAIVAVYGSGHSIREAADQLGSSFAAVAKRISRGRDLVRECVEQSVAPHPPAESATSQLNQDAVRPHERSRT